MVKDMVRWSSPSSTLGCAAGGTHKSRDKMAQSRLIAAVLAFAMLTGPLLDDARGLATAKVVLGSATSGLTPPNKKVRDSPATTGGPNMCVRCCSNIGSLLHLLPQHVVGVTNATMSFSGAP